MSAINTSISYQSQFAPFNTNLSDLKTKSDAQTQMEATKGIDLKPISHKYSVQSVVPLSELGKHVSLMA